MEISKPHHTAAFLTFDFAPSFQNSYWITIKLIQNYLFLYIFFALKWKDWGIEESQ